jgi:hypothetical protein
MATPMLFCGPQATSCVPMNWGASTPALGGQRVEGKSDPPGLAWPSQSSWMAGPGTWPHLLKGQTSAPNKASNPASCKLELSPAARADAEAEETGSMQGTSTSPGRSHSSKHGPWRFLGSLCHLRQGKEEGNEQLRSHPHPV